MEQTNKKLKITKKIEEQHKAKGKFVLQRRSTLSFGGG